MTDNNEILTPPQPDDFEPEAINDSKQIETFGDEQPEQEPAPEPTEETPEEEQSPDNTDTDDALNLTAPNNVHTAPNVLLGHPVYLEDKKKNGWSTTVVPKRVSSLADVPGAWPTAEETANSEELSEYSERWVYGLTQQLSYTYTEKPMYDRTLNNPEALWTQGFDNESGKLVYLRKPEAKRPTQRRVLTGASARDRATRSINMGTTVRVPLVHTGYHVSLGARSVEDLISLDTELALSRSRTGRGTVGMIFQNSHIELVKQVWEFIYDSIRNVNRQEYDNIDLGNEIRVTDLPILYWGMACTMFPSGYPLDLPCSAGPNICTHTERVLLDLDKLLWINSKGLSKAQRAKLGNATHPLSRQEVEDYQVNGDTSFSRVVKFGDTHEFKFKVPTINEYITSGEYWINAMTEKAVSIFTNSEDNQPRVQQHVRKLIATSSLREYAHWVDEIVFDKYDAVVDIDGISGALEDLSSDTPLMNFFLEEIQKFIEDVTVALIAIPNFACPECEKDYVTDEFSKHPELIPLDMLKHFFTLKDLRLAPLMQDM